jgi:dephospho-CoA kinase
MIVGVTGYFACGKDTVAEHLVSRRGFAHLSLSDMIRARLRERGAAITIPNLTRTGNEMRAAEGPGVLGRMAAAAMKPGADYVVTSIRHPAEVEALRAAGDFRLLFVDASIETRYRRSVVRGRAGDFESFARFKAAEESQMAAPESHAQQLARCRDLADRIVPNDGSLDELRRRVDEALDAF